MCVCARVCVIVNSAEQSCDQESAAGEEEEEEEEEEVYSESYTREARFLTRWDQHAVAQEEGFMTRGKEVLN